jgi:mono/diheme cytochrome c family protein
MSLRPSRLGVFACAALAAGGLILSLAGGATSVASAAETAVPEAPAPAPAPEARSVWDGVYTAAQSARGKKAYNSECARCHGDALLGGEDSPPLVDQDFLKGWYGKPVSRLVDQTRRTMPSDGPGRLSRQLCTDIVAYLLDANGFPAGKTDLSNDTAVQKQVTIEAKK